MNAKFTYSKIAVATGFSTPWTFKMIAQGKGKNLTVKTIAERLGFSKVYIYKMIKRGRLNAHVTADGIIAVTIRNLAKWRLSVR